MEPGGPVSYRPRVWRGRLVPMLVGALLGCAAAGLAQGATYKWTDANGRVVYSDQPPASDVKSEVINKAPPPANPNAVKEMATREAELRKRQQERADAAAKGDKARVDTARSREFCQQAAAQLAGLQQADIAIYRLNEKGEKVFLEEPQRKAEAARLERTMREQNCGR